MAFLFHIIRLNDENISILQLIKDCFVWIKLI
ncbi:putative N-acetylmannosamine-6-phosphate 2-epimerase, partial [Haemophilus influenzae]